MYGDTTVYHNVFPRVENSNFTFLGDTALHVKNECIHFLSIWQKRGGRSFPTHMSSINTLNRSVDEQYIASQPACKPSWTRWESSLNTKKLAKLTRQSVCLSVCLSVRPTNRLSLSVRPPCVVYAISSGSLLLPLYSWFLMAFQREARSEWENER